MTIQIVSEDRPYRLICDGSNHFAVLETRCGRVYPVHSLHNRPRPCAPDNEAGMDRIALDQWENCDEARGCYRFLVENEKYYAETLW